MTQQSVEDDKLREIVKPLEWRSIGAIWQADTSIGWYRITPGMEEGFNADLTLSGTPLQSYANAWIAKAAAQADYATRILSAIDTELLASREKLKVVEQERDLKKRVWDVIEARIDAAPKDGIAADGRYSSGVHHQQSMFIDGMRAARLAAINALPSPPSPENSHG